MTTRSGGTPDPMRAGAQMWEAGYQSLFEGWRQAQEFWNGMARSWGGLAGSWTGGLPSAEPGMAAMRELNEAAFAVGQAWMRLPLVMMGGADPSELQDAITRLTEAQGRAYQLWMSALSNTATPPKQ